MKKNIFIIILASFLVCSLCVNIGGFLGAFKKNVEPVIDGTGIVDAESEHEFGGTTVYKADFSVDGLWSYNLLDEVTDDFEGSSTIYGDYEGQNSLILSFIDGEEGSFNIDVPVDSGFGYLYFETKRLLLPLENCSVITIDFDYSFSYDNYVEPDVLIAPYFYSQPNEEIETFSPIEPVGILIEYYLQSGLNIDVQITEGHFTFIIFESDMLVYLDGEYVGSVENVRKENAVRFGGLRFEFDDFEGGEEYSIDNIEINTFDSDYTGPIFDVIYSSDLSNNPDTVLGRKE